MNPHRVLLPLVLTTAAGALVYSLLRSVPPATSPAVFDTAAPRYALLDVKMTRYGRDGTPRLHATAAEIDQYADGSIVGTHMTVTTLQGARAWTASAPHGEIAGRDQPLALAGGVVAHGTWPDTGTPVTLSTPTLWIDTTRHTLHTDSKVALTSPTRNGTATGMRADWLTQDLSLLHDVHLDYDVPASR